MPYRTPEELEFKVTSVTQLSDVRDAVRDIKLYLPTTMLTKEFIDELVDVAKCSKGKAQLKFSLRDLQEDVYLSAHSRKYRVALTTELTDFIEKYNLNYSINVNNNQ